MILLARSQVARAVVLWQNCSEIHDYLASICQRILSFFPPSELALQAIIEGLDRHGHGNWATIKNTFQVELMDRSNVQIKDRAR